MKLSIVMVVLLGSLMLVFFGKPMTRSSAETPVAIPPVADDAKGLPNEKIPDRPALTLPESSKTQPAAAAEAADPDDYEIADAEDVYAGSRRYQGQTILIKGMRCYYADVADFRCLAPSGIVLAIFTDQVDPPAAREWLQRNCDKLKTALTSSKCLFNPSFRYSAKDVDEDLVSGLEQRKVIRPPAGITMIPPKKLSQRRPR